MKRVILTASSLLLAGTVQASAGMNLTRPNCDIRALEPPIEITAQQLRAQGTPLSDNMAIYPHDQGPSVYYAHRPLHHHAREVY